MCIRDRSGTAPQIIFTDTNQDSDFTIKNDGGQLNFIDRTNSNTTMFYVNSGGFGGNRLYVSSDIVHQGDTDTKIVFTDNQIDLQTGSVSRIYASNFGVYVKSGFPLAFLASSGDSPNMKSGGTNNQDLLFNQLTDICGIDYSLFGKPEWNTKEVTSSGYSRGIKESSHGRIKFGDSLDSFDTKDRFCVCYHLLSLQYNHRIRIKVYLNDEPQILHFGRRDSGLEMKPGLCFTIEPMINQGDKRTKVLNDGWTVVTKDGRNSAQWEHTVAVTENGYDVLTKRSEEALD